MTNLFIFKHSIQVDSPSTRVTTTTTLKMYYLSISFTLVTHYDRFVHMGNCYIFIMTLKVFQAVTLNANAYQPHALLMRILTGLGPFYTANTSGLGPTTKLTGSLG